MHRVVTHDNHQQRNDSTPPPHQASSSLITSTFSSRSPSFHPALHSGSLVSPCRSANGCCGAPAELRNEISVAEYAVDSSRPSSRQLRNVSRDDRPLGVSCRPADAALVSEVGYTVATAALYYLKGSY